MRLAPGLAAAISREAGRLSSNTRYLVKPEPASNEAPSSRLTSQFESSAPFGTAHRDADYRALKRQILTDIYRTLVNNGDVVAARDAGINHLLSYGIYFTPLDERQVLSDGMQSLMAFHWRKFSRRVLEQALILGLALVRLVPHERLFLVPVVIPWEAFTIEFACNNMGIMSYRVLQNDVIQHDIMVLEFSAPHLDGRPSSAYAQLLARHYHINFITELYYMATYNRAKPPIVIERREVDNRTIRNLVDDVTKASEKQGELFREHKGRTEHILRPGNAFRDEDRDDEERSRRSANRAFHSLQDAINATRATNEQLDLLRRTIADRQQMRTMQYTIEQNGVLDRFVMRTENGYALGGTLPLAQVPEDYHDHDDQWRRAIARTMQIPQELWDERNVKYRVDSANVEKVLDRRMSELGVWLEEESNKLLMVILRLRLDVFEDQLVSSRASAPASEEALAPAPEDTAMPSETESKQLEEESPQADGAVPKPLSPKNNTDRSAANTTPRVVDAEPVLCSFSVGWMEMWRRRQEMALKSGLTGGASDKAPRERQTDFADRDAKMGAGAGMGDERRGLPQQAAPPHAHLQPTALSATKERQAPLEEEETGVTGRVPRGPPPVALGNRQEAQPQGEPEQEWQWSRRAGGAPPQEPVTLAPAFFNPSALMRRRQRLGDYVVDEGVLAQPNQGLDGGALVQNNLNPAAAYRPSHIVYGDQLREQQT